MIQKKKYNYEALMKRAFSYLDRAMQRKYTLHRISQDLRTIVNSYYNVNRNDRYRLYYAMYSLARKAHYGIKDGTYQSVLGKRKNYDQILKAARKTKASSELRAKRLQTRIYLSETNRIFFLCSVHAKPAEDHKDYQGKIYVDRFWRMKLDTDEERYAVGSYIKNKNIQTVQEIMGKPVWLTTRPYCKHYFIPLKTEDVLGNSVKKLIQIHEAKHRQLPYTTSDYYRLRTEVYSQLEPCDSYRRMMKSR
ncbi:hypothetical protein [Mammaliicoccus vitulinus]|uniref:hypothetical protein n=1 Tax=Mammaliicoccus vitulinus TaxID=71237 RepID=UPI00248AC856|nr:hypothetical protein [Mammaliicoccus vitulinus]